MLQKYLCAVFLWVAIVAGSPYSEDVDDMYSDYETTGRSEDAVIVRTPKFITEQMSMLVNEGETVRLPCIVDRLPGFVLLWKRQTENILAVGEQIIDKRFNLEPKPNGNSLVISQISTEDEGEYTCQISAFDPKFLTHKVKVRVKPEIETVPSELLVVREGEPASLICQVTRGSPPPKLSWTRRHRTEVVQGNMIKWSAVSRHDGGHYICRADNGFGPEPVAKEVKLEVHYVPHVEIGEEFIHTTEGEEARVVCTIHCSPRCDIHWTKDGSVVDQSNQNYYINTLGTEHTLTIMKVSREYLGEYSCTAENQIGKNSASVKVSGLAHKVIFKDSTVSPWTDKFFLEWSAISRSPVESFSVEYRGENEVRWTRVEVKSAPKGDEEWEGSITLEGLTPKTRYEAKVSARNQYGYNDYTEPFLFATKGAEPVQQPSVYNSAVQCTATIPMYINAVITCCIALLYR